MKPFYSDDFCTIYNGDCREILPTLRVGLILTDPPYGIALDTNYSKRENCGIAGRDYSPVVGDASTMDLRFLFSSAKTAIVFGANNFPDQLPFNPKRDGWLCWDKRTNEDADKILGSPFELACIIGRRSYELIRLQHCGVKNADGDNAGRFHPTQKPVVLFTRILSMFAGDVCDPFMGSGTTLIAAKQLGRPRSGSK